MAKVRNIVVVACIAALLGACARRETASAPRVVAECELEGMRLFRNTYARDDRVGEYILTCMRAKGYALSAKPPCVEGPNLRDSSCYVGSTS